MTYPYTEAGWKGTETSRLAAQTVNLKSSHEKVLTAFKKHGPMTPEEAAPLVEMSKYNCRSRCSELKVMGLLFPTGETRKGESGLHATVLSV